MLEVYLELVDNNLLTRFSFFFFFFGSTLKFFIFQQLVQGFNSLAEAGGNWPSEITI